jgi:hypothetical protein
MVLEFAAAAELRFAVAVEDLHYALHMTLPKCSGDNTMILASVLTTLTRGAAHRG